MPKLNRKASKRAKKQRMHEVMHRFKKGEERSSSGKKVTDRKQAIAIGLSESGQSRKKGRKKRRSSRGSRR